MGDLTVERPDRMGDLKVESYEDGGAMPLRVYAYTLLEWKLCAW